MSEPKDNEKTKQLEYPQTIRGKNHTFTKHDTGNKCVVTRKHADALYAKNKDEARSGKVRSIEGLVKERLVDDIAILAHVGFDQKIIDKLEKNNFTLFSQAERYLDDKDKLGLTATELDKLKEVLGGAK